MSDTQQLFEYAPTALLSVCEAGSVARMNEAARHLLQGIEVGAPLTAIFSARVAGTLVGVAQGGAALCLKDVGHQALSLDVTAARGADGTLILALQSARASCIAEERIEAQAAFAGKLAHDLNNILGAVLGYASLMKMELEDGPVSPESVDEILHASRRAKALLSRCLAFSGRALSAFKVREPIALADQALAAVKPLAAPGVELSLRVAPGLDMARINADANQLVEVLSGLLRNGVEAVGAGPGRVTLEVDLVSGGASAMPSTTPPPGRLVRFTVRDTGPGVAPSIRERLFEPFVTSKHGQRGAGLSLAVSLGLARSHGGGLTLDDEDEAGAVFRLWVPLHDAIEA